MDFTTPRFYNMFKKFDEVDIIDVRGLICQDPLKGADHPCELLADRVKQR